MKKASIFIGLIVMIAFLGCEEGLFTGTNDTDALNDGLKNDSVVVNESVDAYLEAYALTNNLNGRFSGVPKAYMSYFMENETAYDEMGFPEIGRGNGHGNGPHGQGGFAGLEITENEDGSFTATMDLSDMGREERNQAVSGVVTETFSYSDSAFTSEVVFEDVSNDRWALNGTASYQGIVQGDSMEYTFSYKAQKHYELQYGDTLYSWTSSSQEQFSREALHINKLEQTLKVNGNAYLNATLVEPLKTDMFCGRRGNKYFVEGLVRLEGNFGSLTLDYGDGDCNEVAIASYNGETFEFSPQGFFAPRFDKACGGQGPHGQGNGNAGSQQGNSSGNGRGNGNGGQGNDNGGNGNGNGGQGNGNGSGTNNS